MLQLTEFAVDFPPETNIAATILFCFHSDICNKDMRTNTRTEKPESDNNHEIQFISNANKNKFPSFKQRVKTWQNVTINSINKE